MKKIFTIILASITGFWGYAQNRSEAASAWLIQPSVAFQMPGGDMTQNFGNNFSIGLGGAYKTENNWRFGVDGQYLFSDNINHPQDLLSPVLTDRGFVLNGIGNYANVSLLQRGFFFSGEIGKSFEFLQVNAHSGPDIQLGAGYLMHWIEIKNAGNDSPQVIGEYVKGYDHLSGGVMLRQSVGYTYLSENRRVNFRWSLEICEAFTENFRGYDYSTGQVTEGRRLDLLYGIRFQWILPIYSNSLNNFYYD